MCGGSARGRIGGGPVPLSGAAVARRKATPLHFAAMYGHADAIAALLGAGTDASIQDCDG